ncbi:MAG: M56 family metallopeptidase [Balneolaceae bacterium]|nr:M56 family metallopeptidase [Balneolaceae bacterium]
MTTITDFFLDFGTESLEILWLPLSLWTLLATAVLFMLKRLPDIDPLFHYHLRIAALATLPFGMAASVSVTSFSGLFNATAANAHPSFIVIQNPISVTGETAQAAVSMNWTHPGIWLGLITLLLLAISLYKLLLLARNYYHLSGYADMLKRENGYRTETDKRSNRKITLVFSPETEIPFTFGWHKPVIVMPDSLRGQPLKLRMAVRHEIMHIKKGDFLVNCIISIIRSTLWFHPLVLKLDREISDYREISCDAEVVRDRTISRKAYARLLFDLAPKQGAYAGGMVSMAVNQSSLHRRINILSKATSGTRPARKSILFSVGMILLFSGLIACSDLQDSGITHNDLQQAQAHLRHTNGVKQPIYVIREDTDLDGSHDREEIASAAETQKISRIRERYISGIKVMKSDEAVATFGRKGSDGAVILNLLDREKAFSDLKKKGDGSPVNNTGNEIFVVAEKMPKLKGGLETIQNCVRYPEKASTAGIEGRVLVQFIVDRDGTVENPKIIRGIGYGADREAIRCVKRARFEPGMHQGSPVRVQFSLPVNYRLSGSDFKSRS